MGHLSRRSAATAFSAVAAFFVVAFVSSSARAEFIPFDFVKYIDVDDGVSPPGGAGEQGVIAPFPINGFNITADAYNFDHDTPGAKVGGSVDASPFAYFDSQGAGIGVCQFLSDGNSGYCVPSNDDNVTGDANDNTQGPYGYYTEVLTLSFGTDDAFISDLWFRNDGHIASFPAGKHVDVYVDPDGNSANNTLDLFTSYLLGACTTTPEGRNADANGYCLYDGSNNLVSLEVLAGQVLNIKYSDQQFYLSGLEMWPVPVPAR